MTIYKEVKIILQQSLVEQNINPSITVSKIKDYDYQTNIAFQLSKVRRSKPLDIAQELLKHLDHCSYEFTVSGPGFINIKVKEEKYRDIFFNLEKALEKPGHKKEKVIVDYSSPNVAKEFHVGHLRSTVIGDALANTLEWQGYEVLRLNHIGDWGTAFGMLIAYIEKNNLIQTVNASDYTLQDLMTWYRSSKTLFDESSEFYEESKKYVVALQQGSERALELWNLICEISRNSYQEIYKTLNISNLLERGESFYNPYLGQVIDQSTEKKLAQVDEGALCLFLDGFKNRDNEPLPLIIRKADGGYNYATTDLAALYHRFHVEKASKVFYVTDSGQKQHFDMIFKAGQELGYVKDLKDVTHVPFGLVLDKNKKKFKTRSGDTIKLTDLLQQGYDRAFKIAQDRGISSPEQFAQVAGISAIKYADLSNNRLSDYVFDFDKMLSFDGNTALYIYYAFVRVESLKKKLGFSIDDLKKIPKEELSFNDYETSLLKTLSEFSHVCEKVIEDCAVNHMTDYLYKAAQQFHSFFQHCPIKDSEHTWKRLYIAYYVHDMLKKGLKILGCGLIHEM